MAFLARFFDTLVALSAAIAEARQMQREADRRYPRQIGYQ